MTIDIQFGLNVDPGSAVLQTMCKVASAAFYHCFTWVAHYEPPISEGLQR